MGYPADVKQERETGERREEGRSRKMREKIERNPGRKGLEGEVEDKIINFN